ncbi:MAG: hypothetical protein M1839_005316 [Geoglossum umbratile]|nr:MAG: hypothetical protein M1839_005316 [Geoglossum umbratile]
MSSRRPRRLLRTNPGQLGTSPGQSATQLDTSTPPRSNNLPTTPLLDKGHLMAMVKTRKPFVSERDRKLLQRGVSEAWWTEGKALHVDFSNEEMAKVLRVIENAFSITASTATFPDINANPSETVEASLIPFAGFLERPAREKIMALASKMAEADILSASARLISEGSLRGRDIEDVRRFLKDAALKRLAMSPTMIQVASLAPAVERGDHVFSTSTDSLLRRRELGLGHARVNWHSTKAIESELKLRVFDEMREWRSWTGGSSDAASIAWDVTGDHFAVGFSAITDAYNMQYNRRNNLMVGDMWTNTIKEFPYHRVPRPRTNLVNVVDDLYLYQTVSQVKFGAKGRWMYSASFDKTVKIWDFAAADVQNRLVATLHQGADVDLMALSTDEQLATGSMDKGATVKVWSINEDDPSLSRIYTSFNSPRKPTVYPSCMQWGQHTPMQKYLLVGFSGSGENRNGDIVVWDAGSGSQIAVSPAAINAFDAVWHPSIPAFVVGCKRPGSDSTRKSAAVRTSLRTYHPISGSFKDQFELGCPAYDINDVTWRHPIIPLAEDEHRERTDTGVRFTQWGNTNDRLYTGSSDGVIKSWNVKRATEDALVADVANLQSIVMSGAFSPDYSRLLVGDGKGSIHVLRTGLDDDHPIERMKFEPGEKAEGSKTEGRDEADRLVANGELMLRFGRHYQGPNYLDADARRQARSVELDLVYQRIHQTATASVTFPTKPSPSTTTQQIVKQESTSNAEASGQGSAMEGDGNVSVDSQEDSMDLS